MDVTTTVFRKSFTHVSNKYFTIEDLLERPVRYDTFPWLNIGLGPQNIRYALAGDIEIASRVPIYIVGYCKCEGEDLQCEIADLIDDMSTALRTNYTDFTAATFSLIDAVFYPYEDEERHEIGWVVAILNFDTGNN